jgi:uncharacterized protein CbrC (UPF0167 family)
MEDCLNLPTFRYHVDPIGSRVFERSDTICPCCQQTPGWTYVGPLFTTEELAGVCPWCIASGAAAAAFDAEFVDPFAVEPGTSPEALDELLHRTPSHFTAQDELWPVHCGDFCAVIGRLKPAELDSLGDEIFADLQALQQRLQVNIEDFNQDLRRQHSPLWTYLFRCVRCAHHRVNGDYE